MNMRHYENPAALITFKMDNAERFVRMGKEKEALDLLHDFINKRGHQWEKKSYETFMLYYMDLCVRRQEHRIAKDGLYQYRSLCQNTDPKSLETVIEHLLQAAERKAEEARQLADERALTEVAKIPDLEEEDTVEQNMEAYEEGLRLQTAKAIIVPWRKFRWEIYRAVIEPLSKNQKFQELYHSTCKAAFNFCKEYQRHREFRFLSDTLTKHLQDLEKQQGNTKQKYVFEWTAENVRLHLDTRCVQLRVAIELELWNEAYRLIQDIDRILSKDACTAEIMQDKLADYEFLLARLFLASEDFLFHACALYKHYTLLRDHMISKKESDVSGKLRSLASTVLLAAMCVPRVDDASKKAADQPDHLERSAQILRFTVKPTRKALLAELESINIQVLVHPELQHLYQCLEVTFNPLGLVQSVKPALDFIRSSTEERLSVYAPALEKVVALRMISQLSAVYSSVRLQFVQQLLSPLSLSFFEIEKLLVNAVADGTLQMKMDHRKDCVKFVDPTAAATSMYGQLYRVAQKLRKAATKFQLEGEDVKTDRKQFLYTIMGAAAEEQRLVQGRMDLIEERKATLRRQQERKREHERKIKETDAARRKAEEDERLQREKEQREREKKQNEEKEKLAKELQAQLQNIGGGGKVVDLEEAKRIVNEGKASEEIKQQRKKQALAEEQRRKRLANQLQKLDFTVRAIRMEEVPIIRERYAELVKQDEERFQIQQEQEKIRHAEHFARELAIKQRLERMQRFRPAFDEKLKSAQLPFFLEALNAHRLKNVENARHKKQQEADRLLMEEEQHRRNAEQEQARLMAPPSNAVVGTHAGADRDAPEEWEQGGDEEGWTRASNVRPRAAPRQRDEPGDAEGDSWSRVGRQAAPRHRDEPGDAESDSWSRVGRQAAPRQRDESGDARDAEGDSWSRVGRQAAPRQRDEHGDAEGDSWSRVGRQAAPRHRDEPGDAESDSWSRVGRQAAPRQRDESGDAEGDSWNRVGRQAAPRHRDDPVDGEGDSWNRMGRQAAPRHREDSAVGEGDVRNRMGRPRHRDDPVDGEGDSWNRAKRGAVASGDERNRPLSEDQDIESSLMRGPPLQEEISSSDRRVRFDDVPDGPGIWGRRVDDGPALPPRRAPDSVEEGPWNRKPKTDDAPKRGPPEASERQESKWVRRTMADATPSSPPKPVGGTEEPWRGKRTIPDAASEPQALSGPSEQSRRSRRPDAVEATAASTSLGPSVDSRSGGRAAADETPAASASAVEEPRWTRKGAADDAPVPQAAATAAEEPTWGRRNVTNETAPARRVPLTDEAGGRRTRRVDDEPVSASRRAAPASSADDTGAWSRRGAPSKQPVAAPTVPPKAETDLSPAQDKETEQSESATEPTTTQEPIAPAPAQTEQRRGDSGGSWGRKTQERSSGLAPRRTGPDDGDRWAKAGARDGDRDRGKERDRDSWNRGSGSGGGRSGRGDKDRPNDRDNKEKDSRSRPADSAGSWR